MLINSLINLINISKNKKILRTFLIIFNDLLIINFSFYLSYTIRLEEFLILNKINFFLFFLISSIYLALFFLLKINLQFFRHFNINSYKIYFKFYLIFSILFLFFVSLNNSFYIPRSITFIFPTLSFILIFINRLFIKNILDLRININKQRIAIFGFSSEIIPLIFSNDEIKIIVDGYEKNINRNINNIKIVSFNNFFKNKNKINKILIYDLNFFENNKKILRKFIFENDITIAVLKKYQNSNFIEDTYFNFNYYFDRPSKEFVIGNYYDNKTILITGGAGSIGSEILKELLKINYKKIIIVDNSEINIYLLMKSLNVDLNNLRIFINNFEDHEFIKKIHKIFKIDIVFHCAAYKHVPLMEIDKFSAIKNNFINSHFFFQNLLEIGVNSICLISSDKAVRPTNIMGASKRLAELSLQYFHDKYYKDINNLKLSYVRFGNVINSSGSVLPLFLDQIKNNKNISLTHKDITRYFMTIEEASNLVINSFAIAKSSDIFLLDMGDAIKLYDLIKILVKFSGKRLSNIKINDSNFVNLDIIGLRHGEKLFEELLIDNLAEKSDIKYIYRSKELKISQLEFEKIFENIQLSYKNNDELALKDILYNKFIHYQS